MLACCSYPNPKGKKNCKINNETEDAICSAVEVMRRNRDAMKTDADIKLQKNASHFLY